MSKEKDYLVIEAIFRAFTYLKNNLSPVFQKYGLTGTEFGILEAIYTLGPNPIQIIAKRIFLSSGGMTYIKKQLIEKNLIFEELCKEDKRVSYLNLTEKGNKLIKEVLYEHDEYIKELLGNLNTEEKDIIVILAKKIPKK